MERVFPRPTPGSARRRPVDAVDHEAAPGCNSLGGNWCTHWCGGGDGHWVRVRDRTVPGGDLCKRHLAEAMGQLSLLPDDAA